MGGLQHGGQKRGCLEERGTKHSHAQPLGHRPLGWGSSTGEMSRELHLVPEVATRPPRGAGHGVGAARVKAKARCRPEASLPVN